MRLADTPNSAGSQPNQSCTLENLVETVGVPMLRVLCSPRGLDAQVRAMVLHDPLEELPEGPDAILLACGVHPDDPGSRDLARAAASLGYCAIVVKRRAADTASLTAAAEAVGLAVLAVSDEVPWRHLDGLLLAVLGARGAGAQHGRSAGEELFALCNAIAAVTGGSVAIEDLDRQILAYSSARDQRIDELRQQGILARRVPDMSRNLWQYRSVLATDDIVHFEEAADEMARSAITIRAGSQPLGTIWAIERLGGISVEAQRVLIDGARLAAVHLLRAREADEFDRQARDGALRGALDGTWTGSEVAFRLSLRAGSDLTLIGFAPLPASDGSTPLITRIGGLLTRHFAAFRPDTAISTTSRTVFVLVPSGNDEVAHRMAMGSLNMLDRSVSTQLRVAIATTATDPAELPRMRSEVESILAVTTSQDGFPAIARLADVHARVILTHLADLLAQQPALRHPGVDAMAAYDGDHGTEYVISVRAWLDAIGDIAAAAGQLGIHANTLRYRLKRANTLFPLRLDKPDDRLSAWMQLRLLDGGQPMPAS